MERGWRGEEVPEILSKYLTLIKGVIEELKSLGRVSICIPNHSMDPAPPEWSSRVALIITSQGVSTELMNELRGRILKELPTPPPLNIIIVNEHESRTYVKALGGIKCSEVGSV